jgi:hypothetical protein
MATRCFKTHVGNMPCKRRWNLAKNSNSNLFAIAINNGLLKQGLWNKITLLSNLHTINIKGCYKLQKELKAF